MQLQQQEKPLTQQLRSTIWQNGKADIVTSLEKLPETLNDPQALMIQIRNCLTQPDLILFTLTKGYSILLRDVRS